MLIPGADLLNHKRGQPVSWVVSCQDATSGTIAIVVHPTMPTPDLDPGPDVQSAVEVFNNYGPKSTDELILGYGFSIGDNPDDTIALQIGGATASHKWIVGRRAHHVDGLWSDIRGRVAGGQSEDSFEDDLETAAVLSDMVQAKLDGMKTVADVQSSDQIRPTVKVMLEHYIAGRHPWLTSVAHISCLLPGQRDILESILEFANEKHKAAIETAREQGIDLVFDDDDI